tara:strand:+ start:2284 stop:3339 length:1056 start_codon:yes stop_codon:yes gene_type:complete
MSRHKCLILGASGLVGQRLQQRLVNHPMFEIGAVAGSKTTAGNELDSIPWRLEEGRPSLPNLTILDANSTILSDECHKLGIKFAFSGLPSSVAKEVEKRLTESGIMVFSNASAYRRKTGIPMIIPEINPHHFSNSMHYCATNCTLIPLAIPVSAISKLSAIKSVKMRSEQALSGAGWELLFDEQALTGKVDPHIENEAEKTAAELLHVSGDLAFEQVTPADFKTDIICQRIARKDGHQVFVEVETEHEITLSDFIDGIDSITTFSNLPSGPLKAAHIVDEIDPKQHLWTDGFDFENEPNPMIDLKTGMAIVVGNITINGTIIAFSAYSHNTVRGAAGGLVYLAEFVLSKNT